MIHAPLRGNGEDKVDARASFELSKGERRARTFSLSKDLVLFLVSLSHLASLACVLVLIRAGPRVKALIFAASRSVFIASELFLKSRNTTSATFEKGIWK